MLIGTHCSIAGGMENAIAQAELLGIDTFHVFTKNQRQWREREFTEEEGDRAKKRKTVETGNYRNEAWPSAVFVHLIVCMPLYFNSSFNFSITISRRSSTVNGLI